MGAGRSPKRCPGAMSVSFIFLLFLVFGQSKFRFSTDRLRSTGWKWSAWGPFGLGIFRRSVDDSGQELKLITDARMSQCLDAVSWQLPLALHRPLSGTLVHRALSGYLTNRSALFGRIGFTTVRSRSVG